MTPSVTVVIPVLGRPHRVAPILAAFHAATPEPHRVLFVADVDDHAELAAFRAAGAQAITVDEPRCYAAKINAAYHATDEPWIFTASDDVKPHRDWFSRALAWANEDHGVIGTNDICNGDVMTGQHSTHSLVRRAYIEECSGVADMPDTVMFPGYGHWWCDTELVGTARFRGRYVHAFDSIVEHLHPMSGKSPDDATYRKGQSTIAADRRIFQSRQHLWNPTTLRPPRPRGPRRVTRR